ncbi:disease resistance protein Pik-2-like isoform X2 [Panicum virgatum]|jgi:disease resistance protein RPM1|uniref:disease resistance protein Pik-2-like isoform X2 n=1 Tax=Panicum virgatum TaxID=38727 RepID=UPI0019D58D45|nr:disease resistance protein Pik-2-like isoform X2 [Panicum virgatum]
MELAMAAVSSFLPKLGTLLTDEYKLQNGVRGEIKFLGAEMESMQAALKKVSELPAHQIDDDVEIWARELKELSYDIEDSVDTFMVRVDASVCTTKPHSFRRFFDRAIGLLTKAKIRRRIATNMVEIKTRLHAAADRRARYKFEDFVVRPDSTVVDFRLPALYEDAKNLVGIDGSAEKLTALLMHGEGAQRQQLMVVSIAGVGGLGKTTLANSAFQRLRGDFESQAFVSVSLKPDIKKIFSSILRRVSGME